MREFKLFKRLLEEVDFAIEIIDSRCVLDSKIKKAEEIVKKKELNFAIVVNKSDLIDKEDIPILKDKINEKNIFFISSRRRLGTKKIRKWFSKLKKKLNKEKIKGLIFGYPNVGKSSFLNILKGKKSAGVSSIPGHTKGKQYLRITSYLTLVDMPGIFLPLDKKQKALLGIVNPNSDKEDLIEYCWYLINELKNMKYGKESLIKYGFKIEDFKKIESWDYFNEVMEEKAKQLNYFIKGGNPDISRLSKKIIIDWQKSKIRAYKLYL